MSWGVALNSRLVLLPLSTAWTRASASLLRSQQVPITRNSPSAQLEHQFAQSGKVQQHLHPSAAREEGIRVRLLDAVESLVCHAAGYGSYAKDTDGFDRRQHASELDLLCVSWVRQMMNDARHARPQAVISRYDTRATLVA